ncbi:hypothetical protein BN159_3610 [Streptomyces davaonensis JCM 4913]|uniref:Uncharacterized protein n=1 Tax=Streptomyces davaonensis (strain DSM 101723 / JCM 4913 / KCC S-0913 / 768) TaxID=1214101 RepID=K4R5J6_STRDJ|nr:hypothetical protein [Streptomyces davaonensis]CCK27989.1 hypothetical protein BN159_3610 [Streptomyces davaonensis JCM 4913]
MKTDGLSEPGERARVADAAGQGELGAEGRPPATTVPVMPLWEGLGGGVSA